MLFAGLFFDYDMHLKGVEPSHTAPEAVALSIELQVPKLSCWNSSITNCLHNSIVSYDVFSYELLSLFGLNYNTTAG